MALQTIFKLYSLVFTVDGDRESNIHEIKAGNVYCKHIMKILLFLLFLCFWSTQIIICICCGLRNQSTSGRKLIFEGSGTGKVSLSGLLISSIK